MTIMTKLNTLWRAGLRESAERVTEANAIRIYRQEIVDAEELLAQRRDALAVSIATRRQLEADIERLQQRAARREQQVTGLPPAERTEAVLTLAAEEIAGLERELEDNKQRHVALCAAINREERALRQLLGEIREHRREIRLLESQRRRQCAATPGNQTISGRLAALKETRAAICGTVTEAEHLEESMEEAIERVTSSPLERSLRQSGQDEATQRAAAVLARLKAVDAGA